MNIKTTLILCTSILASSASAQVTTILPGGRGHIYIGTQVNLPGPTANIVISPRISLPAPLLTPSVAILLSPAPASIPTMPISLPTAIPALPVALPSPHPSELVYNVSAGYSQPRALMAAHFAAPSKDVSPANDVVAAREKLENLFDGKPVAEKRDEPVRSDRRQSLPENDLEKEIGAY